MITRKIDMNIEDLTMTELANEICELSAEDQLSLINEIASITKEWGKDGLLTQLCSINEFSNQLTPEGKWFLEMFNEYLL